MTFVQKVLLFIILTVVLYTCWGIVPRAAQAELQVAGKGAILMNCDTGQVLYEKNSRMKLYPASTTKIVTAAVVLENTGLKDIVTVSSNAEGVEGSSIWLREGERLTVEELLYALMLNSANDAAVALAEYTAGSAERFAVLMNRLAEKAGARNSHFINPHGLPDDNHYTTAYDLALISRYAMHKPEFRKIVKTRQKTISRADPDAQKYMFNHNKLLWRYEGATGIKTGYTTQSGQCIVGAAKKGERELISVVLDSIGSNLWTDAEKLLDYGFNNYKTVRLVKGNKKVGEVPVKGVEDRIPAVTAKSFSWDLPVVQTLQITRQVFLKEEISPPLSRGQKVGELVFYGDGIEIGRVDLLAARSVQQGIGFRWWLLAIGIAAVGVILIRERNRRKRWERYLRRRRYWRRYYGEDPY